MRKSGIPTYTPLRSGRKSDASIGTLSVQSNRLSSGGYRYSMGRPSIMDSVRRSSVADQQGRKERLNIDQATHQQNYQSLVAFLNDNHYDKPRTCVRCQGTNSSKEVSNIFLFLLGIINPGYTVTRKFEDEFPIVMKMLRYQFVITKSCFQPIGTPRYWPHIVNALYWMTCYAKYLQTSDKAPFKSSSISTTAVAKSAAFKLNLAAYHLFMAEEDEKIPVLDEEFMENELQSYLGVGMQEAVKMAELKSILDAHRNEICQNKQSEADLDLELLQLESDYNKLVKFNKEAQVFIGNVKTSIERKEKTVEQNEKLIDEIRQSSQEKQAVVSGQKFTIYDIQRKKYQIELLKAQVETANIKYEHGLKEHSDSELDLMKIMEKFGREINEYHSLASRCKIIPSSAENAKGYDYSIVVQNPKSESSPSNISDIKGRLTIILKQWKEANRSVSTDILALKDDINKFQNMLTSTDNKIVTANSAFSRQEDAFLSNEQEFKKVNKKLTSELLGLEQNIAQLRSVAKNTNVDELEAKVCELKTKLKDMQEAFAKREHDIKECLLDMLSDFTQHKNYVTEKKEAISKIVTEHCARKEKNEELQYKSNQEAIDDLREKAKRLCEEAGVTEAEFKKFNVN